MKDLISIVVPVYKAEKYLKRCIDSILNQTYENIEVILVNDGSPDNSGSICDEYKDKDNRIKVIHKENAGVSAARNSGLKIASGNYITFIDSDDYVDNNYVEKLYNLFDDDTDITMCNATYVKDENIVNKTDSNEVKLYNNIELCKNIKEFEKGGIGSVCWGKMYRKSLLDKVWFKEGMINEDEVFLHEIFYITRQGKFTCEQLYNYCIYSTDSIMRSRYNISRLDALKAFELRLDFYKDKNEELYNQTMIKYLSVIGINYFLTKKYIENSKQYLKEMKQKIKLNYKYAKRIKCSLVWKVRLFFIRYFTWLYGYFMYVVKKRGESK